MPWQEFIYGLLLGYGAAIPLGPMNLEMFRRNFLYSTKVGMSFGLGACLVDATCIILLGFGLLTFLTEGILLRMISFAGGLILFWFAYKAWTATQTDLKLQHQPLAKALWRHILEGYLMTAVNPFTLIFWASASPQIVIVAADNVHAFWAAVFGVLVATVTWVLGANILLSLMRHKITKKIMDFFNKFGAILLAIFGMCQLYLAI
jgi:L-lysine exporter family protein LysE/ArgO